MSSVISSTGRRPALLIAGILLIATTLRVVFTGAAPLLDAIRSDYGLTTAQTGLLTTLPLLAFGLVSPLAAGVARRFGMERSLLLAMLLICAGIALRSLPSAAWLFIGTAVIGCGIALGNVLLPGLIKRDFSQHVARMTGAYSLTMGGAAALGSALVVPVAMAGFGWRGALLLLMIFPLLALVSWLPQSRRQAEAPLTGSGAMHNRGIWRSALAWQVTLFLGINSLVYYVIIGWLPSILQSMGYSEAQAGSLHGLLQLATAAPGLAIPLILHRLRDQRGIAVLVALMCAISAAGLWLLPGLAIGWTLLFGFARGHDDPRPDVYRPARRARRTRPRRCRDGAERRLSAGRLRTAADGQDPRCQWRLAYSAAGGGADFAGDGGLRRPRRARPGDSSLKMTGSARCR